MRILCGLFVVAKLCSGCAPASTSPVRLNEIMPANNDNCRDEAGEHDDWIELFNTSDVAVDLGGYSLTDDTSLPGRSVIPDGVTIAAHASLLFWADKTPGQGATHLDFGLHAAGEEVVLYDKQSLRVDLFSWTNAPANFSFARVPDGTGGWVRCRNPTCGQPNGTGCGS